MTTESAHERTRSRAPIFIIGLPRSGSTLWSNVLAKHPEVARLNGEMHFLHPWYKDFRHLMRHMGDLGSDENVQRLVSTLFAEPLAEGLRRGPYFWRHMRELESEGLADALATRLIQCPERDIGTIFRAIIEEAARCHGRTRAAVKFPVYPAYMSDLIGWWPESRIVYITRDPRAIAASKTNDPGGTRKLSAKYPLLSPILPFAGMTYATLQYIWASHAHARLQGTANYRMFRYEDLMSDPVKTIRELCEFCLLDFDDAMLEPDAGQASSVTGRKSGGFDPSRMHGWREKLSPWQSKTIALLTRRAMHRFGYEPD